VWIDRLDIRPGRQWDREVQEALRTSSEVLVILSPASIASDHVMNEVAYALDERIPVIPVHYAECHVPFHLRRLQFVDFRTDYEVGLQALISEITVAGTAAASTSTDVPREGADLQAPLPPASRRHASKALAVGAASFLAIGAVGGGVYWWMFKATTPTRQVEAVPRQTAAPVPTAPAATVPVVLGDALPIRLTLAEDIPGDAAEGDALRFRVSHDVLVQDTVVIPTGAEAIGVIVDRTKKNVFGMGGKMTFRLEKVDAVEGQKVKIRATPARDRDGSSQRPVSKGTAGAQYLGYIDASNTVMVTRIAR